MIHLNRVLRGGTFLSTTFMLLALGPVFAQTPDQHDDRRMQHQGQRPEQKPERAPNTAVEAPRVRRQQRDEATGQDDRRRPEANPSMRAEPRLRDGRGPDAQMRKGTAPSAQERDRLPSAAPKAVQNQGRPAQDRRELDRGDHVPSGLQRPPRLEGDVGQPLPPHDADRSGNALMAPTTARRLDDVRRARREVREGNQTIIREPGRTIVQQDGHDFIVHDEADRFRALGLNVRRERRGNQFVDTVARPGGEEIVTFTDESGRLLRRVRRTRDGREFVLIDNGNGPGLLHYEDDIIVLPPPAWRIPRDRYVVDYRRADADLLYETLIAPPLLTPARRYTLDQIRYSPDIRGYLRAVEINTINFDSGSWDVPASATSQLEMLATAIKRAIDRNPNSIFLVEGYTDATGNPEDNLSLSDRRAQAVAEVLTKGFDVPPENLTTQGYGEQNPRENTQGPSAANRRVVVQNVTQMLAGQAER